MFWAYVTAICVAFSLAVGATPLVRRAALLLGAVDVPDGKRKLHDHPTPAMGGLGVAAAFFGALVLDRALLPGVETLPLIRLLPPSVFIVAVGLWDDLRGMRPRVKLVLQAVAAFGFFLAGFRLERVFGCALAPWLSLLLTVLWLVTCANVVNLFDGMDGLASGLSLFTALALLAIAGYQGKAEVAVVAAALGGACLGFLLFNFPPAVIFLGDTGSLFLGMMLGVLAIEGSFKSHVAFALVVPVIALGLPITDTLLAVLRRTGRRVSVFSADKDHIHHRLVAYGFTRRQALIVLYALSVVLASLSLLIAFLGNLAAGALIVAGGVVIALVARFLGAGDLQEFGFFIVGGLGRRRAVAHHRRVVARGLRALSAANTVEAICARAARDLGELGFDTIEVEWRGARHANTSDGRTAAGPVWRWETHLGETGWLRVSRCGGSTAMTPEIPTLVEKYASALAGALSRVSSHTQEQPT